MRLLGPSSVTRPLASGSEEPASPTISDAAGSRSMSFVAIGVQQVRLDRRNEHSSFDSRQRDAADR